MRPSANSSRRNSSIPRVGRLTRSVSPIRIRSSACHHDARAVRARRPTRKAVARIHFRGPHSNGRREPSGRRDCTRRSRVSYRCANNRARFASYARLRRPMISIRVRTARSLISCQRSSSTLQGDSRKDQGPDCTILQIAIVIPNIESSPDCFLAYEDVQKNSASEGRLRASELEGDQT